MEGETAKISQGNEVSIALMQKDIAYMRESMGKIETTMAMLDRNFARKDEMQAIEKSIEATHKDIKAELDKKVDRADFDPIKKILGRINMMLITVVVGAVLALIVRAGS